MRQFLFLPVLSFLVFAGCQTLGTKMTDEHARSHNIEIELNEKGKKSVRYVDIIHRLKNDRAYLTVSGSVQKPFGTFSSWITVDVKLIDNKGQIVFNENQRVSLHRTGARTYRRYIGSFFIQVPDNPDIVRCEVDI